MTALLRLDQVSGRHGPITALHPLTLEVLPGARHAVIGPPRAGTSTLLRLIAGSHPVAGGGRIVLAGRDITHHSVAARARAGIARTLQPGAAGTLTVAENLNLALQATGPPARHGRRHTLKTALDQIGLTAHARVRADRLFHTQRRLLEIGMALATGPRLLLLDDPSAGLDPAGIRQVTTVLTALPAETAMILVDRHLPLVWATAATVTVLRRGRQVTTGTVTAVRADQRARDAYLTRADTPANGTRP